MVFLIMVFQISLDNMDASSFSDESEISEQEDNLYFAVDAADQDDNNADAHVPLYSPNLVSVDVNGACDEQEDYAANFHASKEITFKRTFLPEVWSMIASFKIVHRISDLAVLDLCKMFNSIISYSSPAKLPATTKSLMKQMSEDCLIPKNWVVYCTRCLKKVLDSSEKPAKASCTSCR